MATQVGAAYVELGAKITGLERGLKSASAQVDAFGSSADKSAAKVGSKFQALGARMSTVGRKMTLGLTLPIVGIGVAAFKMASDFERSMSKITGLVGIARGQVDAMRKGVLDLSRGTGKSAAELADGLFVITSAGLRGQDAMDALSASAKAGTAGLGETNDIARAVAGSMNAYGSAMLDAGKATDIIVATARAGNFETSQLAGALGRVLPFAKQAGASLEQVGGAVALLTRTNGNAAESITQVTALMRAFVVPTEEGKKILSGLGVTAGDVRKQIGKEGLVSALQMLDGKLGGNREQLGRLLGSTEAAGAAFQILDADAQTLNDTFGVVGKSAGMTDEAFGAAADTAQFKMQQAIANMQAALIDLGGAVAPVVSAIASGISKIVGAFTSLPGPVKTAAAAFAVLVAAIGPLLWMGGKVVGVIGAMKVAMAGMGAASAGTTAMGAAAGGAASNVGMLGAALPMLANPLGLTVAAVGVGVAALFMFRNELSASERFMNGMSESAKLHADAIKQVNTDYRNAVTATGALNTSNQAAASARAKHSQAVRDYNAAVAAGKGPNETEAQYLQRIAGLRVAAAQANVEQVTATTQNNDAVRKAVDNSAKLTDGITKESQAARERLDRAKEQVAAGQRFNMSAEAQAKASAELAQAQAQVGLVEARRTQRLKEVEKQQVATRDAIKKSSMTDAEKSASLAVVNGALSKTRSELKKVDGTNVKPKKITANTADAEAKIDTVKRKLNELDGKTVNPLVNIIERVKRESTSRYMGGYVPGFAGGGQVRGPGGRDRVPAMLTAGEVVLTKQQQAMVDRGVSIRDAIRKTGGAFAKGGFVAPKRNKDESDKAYRARVKAARANWNREQDATTGSAISSAFGTFSSNYLSRFDSETSRILAGIEKGFTGTGVLAGKTFAQLDTDLAANLKSIEANFVGTGIVAGQTFKSLDKAMRAAQKQLNATFDALTPAEAKLKALQEQSNQEGLAQGMSDAQKALADAQAQMADAKKWGDTAGMADAQQAIVDAQRQLRDAERAVMIDGLQKTAEAERAQREEDRQAAQDAFNEEWDGKRTALQEQLDGQLEAERVAGENRKALLQQQLDERLAAEQANRDTLREQREMELVTLEEQMMAARKKYRGQAGALATILGKLAKRMEISGRNVGKSLADGLNAAKGDLRGAALGLANMLSAWLEAHSPTKLGPMSNLDKWWEGVAPALVGGIDTGAMEAGLAKAASLEGAAAVHGTRMNAGRAGAVINLNITDQTFAGMSREQADRVARDIQAALNRRVSFSI